VAFYACLVLAFYAAPYANLLYLLLLFLTATGAMSIWWAFRGLRSVDSVEWTAEPMPAGSGGSLHLHVEGVLKTPGLSLRLHLEKGESLRLALPSQDLSVQTLRVQAKPRGIYSIDTQWLVSSWPLGLFATRIAVQGPKSIVVYPEPADLAAYRLSQGGRGEDRAPGSGCEDMQPASLREYKQGDDSRRIHWKASARKRVPVVKEYEDQDSVGHELVFDLRLECAEFEQALSLVAALVLEMRDLKGSLLLHTQHGSIQYGAQGAAWDDLLTFLAGVSALPKNASPPPVVSPTVQRVSEALRA
jgi:uncharacterized protein (DUF58 family)